MKYSFIVPIYNVEKYLEKCVSSILNQTYTDYEIILVDDGSKDSSPKICDCLVEQDARIKVIHKKNGGLSDARNAGTDIALGEYIIFIDSDDFFIKDDFLEKVNEKTSESPDLIFYKYQKFFESSQRYDECRYSYATAQAKNSYSERVDELVKADAFYGMAWIKAIKKSLLNEHGIRFEVGLLGEDMEWNYHLMINAQSMELIDEPVIAYRQREGSITATHKIKNLTDFIYVLEKWSFFIRQHLTDEILKEALLGSLAKYYSNMLVVYARLKDPDKKKYCVRIKKLSWLLEYSMSNRPKMISRIYKIFGFKVSILMLQIIDCIRGYRNER